MGLWVTAFVSYALVVVFKTHNVYSLAAMQHAVVNRFLHRMCRNLSTHKAPLLIWNGLSMISKVLSWTSCAVLANIFSQDHELKAYKGQGHVWALVCSMVSLCHHFYSAVHSNIVFWFISSRQTKHVTPAYWVSSSRSQPPPWPLWQWRTRQLW